MASLVRYMQPGTPLYLTRAENGNDESNDPAWHVRTLRTASLPP